MADRHPNKEINGAVELALSLGWILVKGHAHSWGTLRCPGGRGACSITVASTPRDREAHARRLRRYIGKCPHTGG